MFTSVNVKPESETTMNAPSKAHGQELTAAELKATLESLKQAYRINPYPEWSQRKAWWSRVTTRGQNNISFKGVKKNYKLRADEAINCEF